MRKGHSANILRLLPGHKGAAELEGNMLFCIPFCFSSLIFCHSTLILEFDLLLPLPLST